ncbi:CDP-diacylglycerol--glycerol-3-phosphate 3-phosphatidyltransferase 2 [Hibiscus syriacus]|uniref:CDP-diacylglycerol--glycerol-3-phosphate 1-phosphatidyltransferase n=1 Tax=Hibiscus syriacus TaxID=106335 RepID=A0A6A2XT44_HIBSY|nr:CDP-diacylglycerol--glycerol-3-phosphate 3-phosphatidyltransferase 2-like [Hibiscus syriacus]KAE8661589.1 CDP-diacylglycerol--glycerol-3-phosphate 3-phosphatidyltransferase 2 [Hibiscus syriacus]
MSGIKLSLSASVYVKPAYCVRTITAGAVRPPPPLHLSWRTTAPFSTSALISNSRSPKKNLLPFIRFPFLTRFSSSAINKGALHGSASGSDLILMDMNPDSKTLPLIETQQNKHNPNLPSSDKSSSKILTLPTVLTLGRVAAVPLLIFTFYADSWWGRPATTSIFVAAAITDWLDGYIARKMRLHSVFGAFLDPVADKLMVAATLVLLCSRPVNVVIFGQVPWLLIVPSIVIIGREITMSAVREWAASKDIKLLEAVAVNNLGKWKTATQMTALTILLATQDSSFAGSGILVPSGVILLYISAGLSVMSLAVYMGKIRQVLLK